MILYFVHYLTKLILSVKMTEKGQHLKEIFLSIIHVHKVNKVLTLLFNSFLVMNVHIFFLDFFLLFLCINLKKSCFLSHQ